MLQYPHIPLSYTSAFVPTLIHVCLCTMRLVCLQMAYLLRGLLHFSSQVPQQLVSSRLACLIFCSTSPLLVIVPIRVLLHGYRVQLGRSVHSCGGLSTILCHLQPRDQGTGIGPELKGVNVSFFSCIGSSLYEKTNKLNVLKKQAEIVCKFKRQA